MLAANPGAVWEHFAWNFKLTRMVFSLALQRLIREANPDYIVSPLWSTTPLTSIAMAVVWLIGRNHPPALAKDVVGPSSIRLCARVARHVRHRLRRARCHRDTTPRPSVPRAFGIVLIAITGTFLWALVRSCGWANDCGRSARGDGGTLHRNSLLLPSQSKENPSPRATANAQPPQTLP